MYRLHSAPVSGSVPLDLVVLAILAVAALRGLYLGLIREAFSIAALGAACVAVRLFTLPAAALLLERTGWHLGDTAARWAVGAAIAVAVVVGVASIGRLLRWGARAAGLGWADRLGGGALGAAEGALIAAIVLLIAAGVLGREHPSFEGSRSFAAFQQLEQIVEARLEAEIDVAAPPPLKRR